MDFFPTRKRRRCVKRHLYKEPSDEDEPPFDEDFSQRIQNDNKNNVEADDSDEEEITINIYDFLSSTLLPEASPENAADSGVLSDCHSQFRVTSSVTESSQTIVEDSSKKETNLSENAVTDVIHAEDLVKEPTPAVSENGGSVENSSREIRMEHFSYPAPDFSGLGCHFYNSILNNVIFNFSTELHGIEDWTSNLSGSGNGSNSLVENESNDIINDIKQKNSETPIVEDGSGKGNEELKVSCDLKSIEVAKYPCQGEKVTSNESVWISDLEVALNETVWTCDSLDNQTSSNEDPESLCESSDISDNKQLNKNLEAGLCIIKDFEKEDCPLLPLRKNLKRSYQL